MLMRVQYSLTQCMEVLRKYRKAQEYAVYHNKSASVTGRKCWVPQRKHKCKTQKLQFLKLRICVPYRAVPYFQDKTEGRLSTLKGQFHEMDQALIAVMNWGFFDFIQEIENSLRSTLFPPTSNKSDLDCYSS